MTERVPVTIEGDEEYSWVVTPGYETIVDTFGEILVATHDGSYQGDSLYLIRRSGAYGILTFGWGSCSGCDALEACDSQEDVDRLQDSLEAGIKWFDDMYHVRDYLSKGGLGDSWLSFELITDFFNEIKNMEDN